MCSCPFDNIPKVDIDPQGVFKYILLKVHDTTKRGSEETITILRGYRRHDYHSDIYDEVQAKLHPLDCEPLGGGRIAHQPELKKIQIYGYSQGYGKADHHIAAKMIKEAYPEYKIIIDDSDSYYGSIGSMPESTVFSSESTGNPNTEDSNTLVSENTGSCQK